jgi:NhaP-type Na+/H+ or K+/H+ antiporter
MRQALNVESGLNDGIALPAVLIFVCLAGSVEHGETGLAYWLEFVGLQLTLGPLTGIAVGYVGGKLLERAGASGLASSTFQDIVILGLAFLSFGLAEWMGGNGFIAAFCGGITLGNAARGLCESLYEFLEAEGQLLGLIVFMIFGAAILPNAGGQVEAAHVIYAVLSLTLIRMIPVALSMIGTGVRPASLLFLGWFGPRGLASILFALLVVEEADMMTGDSTMLIVTVTVALSVVAHGLSSNPGAQLYARRLGCSEGDGTAESHPVTEMPTRFRSAP